MSYEHNNNNNKKQENLILQIEGENIFNYFKIFCHFKI